MLRWLLGLCFCCTLVGQPMAPAAPAAPHNPYGKWRLSPGKSKADGTPTLACTLEADQPIKTLNGTETPVLVFRYKDGDIDAYARFGIYLGEDKVHTEVNFGDAPAETIYWTVSEDGMIGFVPDDAFAFMSKWKKVSRVTITIARPNRDPVTVRFSTDGVDKVIDAVLKTAAK